MFGHRIYGLDVVAAAALPGFPAGDTARAPGDWVLSRVDVIDVPDRAPDFITRPSDDDDDNMRAWREGHGMVVAFPDQTRFLVDVEARALRVTWPASLTFEDTVIYLVGPALGAVLRLLDRTVLHASGLEWRGEAVLVAGASGAGKSTLASSLVEAGLPLVCEDVAALVDDSERLLVSRGPNRIKLWEASVEALTGDANALPQLVPTNRDWTKRAFDASARQTHSDALPVAAVLLLEREEGLSQPELRVIPPQGRVLSLVGNTYLAGLLDVAGRARELERLTRLARQVPVLKLAIPDDIRQIRTTAADVMRVVDKMLDERGP